MSIKKTKRIYLDHAAITPIAPEVLTEMGCYSTAEYGNPSSIYAEGVAAKKAVENARKRIAGMLHGHPDELIFMASGTEANNLAIAGTLEALARSNSGKKFLDMHIIVSAIEHASVLEVARAYERKGARVEYLGVNEDGRVDPDELKKMIRSNTALISIMHVNNEIGTIQPISEIAKVVRHARNVQKERGSKNAAGGYPYLHVDACQSLEYLPIDLRGFGADIVTFDGQKIYGPRGIGLLWARRGIALEPLICGGGQERGLRSGTENVAAICGLARAFEIALDPKRQAKEVARVCELRDYFVAGLRRIFSETYTENGKPMIENRDFFFNGTFAAGGRIASNVNISLPSHDTEFLLLQLDAHGIACSTKSSCLRDEDESYVVRALGDMPNRAAHSLRFSLGRSMTMRDMEIVLKTIADLL